MATIKKAKAGIRMKKAENGTSQAGVGPSSDYKERQFGASPKGKTPSNSFYDEEAEKGALKRELDAKDAAKSSAPEKKQSFGEAFKAARADPKNKGTFSWNGKSYTTETKDEAAKKATTSKPSTASKPSTPASKPRIEAIPEKGNESKRKMIGEVEMTAKKKTNLLPEVEVTTKRLTPKPSSSAAKLKKGGKVKAYKFGGKMKKKC